MIQNQDQRGLEESARCKTSGGNSFNITPFYQEIGPQQSIDVSVTLKGIKPESLEEYFEVMVQDSKSLFYSALAEI